MKLDENFRFVFRPDALIVVNVQPKTECIPFYLFCEVLVLKRNMCVFIEHSSIETKMFDEYVEW